MDQRTKVAFCQRAKNKTIPVERLYLYYKLGEERKVTKKREEIILQFSNEASMSCY